MPHPVYTIPCDVAGRLSVMPCPPADGLGAALEQLATDGVTVVLSMLATDEMQALGVEREPQLCAAQGIRFLSHPIVDFGLPDLASFSDLTDDLATLLQAGENIVVHCRAGIGRSGMVAAAVLVRLGQKAPDALKMVSAARGVSVPDTVEQQDFVITYAKQLNCDIS